MNQLKTSICFILCFLMFSRCIFEKMKLVKKYDQIKSLIEEQRYEALINTFDSRSKAYIELITDTSFMDYDKINRFAPEFNMLHISSQYFFFIGEDLKDPSETASAFFFYCKLKNVPLYDLFGTYKVVESETKIGDENYVTVARKVQENTFLTKKVNFIKEQGEYKLDFLSLFKRTEKEMKRQVNRFEIKYINNLPDELLNNKDVDTLRYHDPLYLFMHFNNTAEFEGQRFKYQSNKAKKNLKTR